MTRQKNNPKVSIAISLSQLILFICISAVVFGRPTEVRPALKINILAHKTNPLLKNLIITVSCQDKDSLTSLTLFFNDKSCGANTKAMLFTEGRFSGSIKPKTTVAKGIKRYFLNYVLPPFVVGRNQLTVLGQVKRNTNNFQVTDSYAFEYELPRSNNYVTDTDNGNYKTVQLHGIPIFANITYRNSIDIFKDADQDGLLDSWENFFLEAIRPSLRFHPDEMMLKKPGHKVLTLARVTPFQDNKGSSKRYIVVRYVFAFSKDYGYTGNGGHNGDTQLFISVWEIMGENQVRLVGMRGAVHKGAKLLQWPTATMLDFFPHQLTMLSGRPVLSVEKNKHGIWPQIKVCNENSFYNCYDNSELTSTTLLSPPVLNVGDSIAGTQFVDKFSFIKFDGPHRKAFGYFKGESIWSSKYFHGGLGDDGDRTVGAIGNFLADSTDQFDISQQMPDIDPEPVTFR